MPAVLAAAAVVLAGCTGSSDSSNEEPAAAPSTSTPSATPTAVTAPPPPPAPEAGACYRLSYAEAVAPTNQDTAVPCNRPHTSQTFAVGRLDLVANGHLLAVDSDAVQARVARRCPGRLAAYLGATQPQLRLSLLRPVWFTPTIEESDAGAAWYRCDVIAVTGDKQIAKLDRTLAGAFAEPEGRSDLGMCGTAQPGTAAFRRVLCRDDHTWKAITVVDLADLRTKANDGRYPGEARVKDAGQDVCADAARAVASDPLDYEWGYEWPTKDQWQAGQTYGRCWSPDPP